MRVVVFDPCNHAYSHANFNAALIDIVCRVFADTTIRFFAHQSHIECVGNILKASDRANFRLQSFTFSESWRPEINAVRFLLCLLRLFRHGGVPELLIISHGLPSFIPAIRLLLPLSRRRLHIHAILHGELSELLKKPANPGETYHHLGAYRQLSKSLPSQLQFVVLEEPIASKLTHRIPSTSENLYVLPHPLPLATPVTGPPPFPPITIGFPGLATLAKGFDVFVRMARAKTPGLRFWAIGKQHLSTDSLDLNVLDRGPDHGHLKHSEYASLIARCHYLCLPHSGPYYDYAASGSLMDAVALRIPVIAITFPAIQCLWDKYGPFGFLFASADDLLSFTPSLPNCHDPATYAAFQDTLGRIAADRSPQELTKILRMCLARTLSNRFASVGIDSSQHR